MRWKLSGIVQQEPADELAGIEGHHLGLAARSVVFPGEADFAVGDGDAMGVTAEIGQHLLGPPERWLGVDHPVEAAELAETTGERLWLGKVGELAEEP